MVRDLGQLLAPRQVIRKLRKGDEGDGTGTGSRGAAAVLGTWGCLWPGGMEVFSDGMVGRYGHHGIYIYIYNIYIYIVRWDIFYNLTT